MAETFAFSAQKTMYGGKRVAKGDVIFVFASENEGGPGLIASGIVTSSKSIPKKRGIARQTPRVSITIKRTALAKHLSGETNSSAFAIGTTVDPRLSLILNSIVRQRTSSPVSRMKQRHSSTDSFKAAFGDYSQTASPHA